MTDLIQSHRHHHICLRRQISRFSVLVSYVYGVPLYPYQILDSIHRIGSSHRILFACIAHVTDSYLHHGVMSGFHGFITVTNQDAALADKP